MTRKIIENAGLAIRCSSKLELVSHTSNSHPFLGFCKDVEFIIEEFKIRHPLLAIKYG